MTALSLALKMIDKSTFQMTLKLGPKNKSKREANHLPNHMARDQESAETEAKPEKWWPQLKSTHF